MPSIIYLSNGLSADLSASTAIVPALGGDDWSDPVGPIGVASGGGPTELYWIDREADIGDRKSWLATTALAVGGLPVQLQVQRVGTVLGNDLSVQIVAGDSRTGWRTGSAQLRFAGTDGAVYRVAAACGSGSMAEVAFSVAELPGAILPQIDHVVVLMNENRSFDNLIGWLYADGSAPAQFLPAGSAQYYDGLTEKGYCNADPDFDAGAPVYAVNGTTAWPDERGAIEPWFVPSPDPGEEFDHVRTQIFNGGAAAQMSGFLTDYLGQCDGGNAAQIMQSYSTAQVPVISQLARAFAVSDAWYASVPSQTWPNRGFAQTGSSDGKVNNDDYIPWDIETVFDVFSDQNLSWMVYNDGAMPALTKLMFLDKYIDNESNFSDLAAFQSACAQAADAPADQKLPAFSFVEPNFGLIGHDQTYHPPHDIRPGERYLADVYAAVQQSPYRDKIMFVVLFDEHGGTYDHVAPPDGAQPPWPHPVSTDGSDFGFDRFGVRVPAIVASSWVTPGTVFRSDTGTPLDHTSVLATLRDWQGLSDAFASMLPSPRIVSAPNLAYVLTQTSAQPWPVVPGPRLDQLAIFEPPDEAPLSGVQKGILIGAAGLARRRPFTREESRLAQMRLQTHGDGRAWMATFAEKLPMR